MCINMDTSELDWHDDLYGGQPLDDTTVLKMPPMRLSSDEMWAALHVMEWPRLTLPDDPVSMKMAVERDYEQYQKLLLKRIRRKLADMKAGSALLDPPVGAGKTYLIAKVLYELGRSQMWFLPTHDLVSELMNRTFSSIIKGTPGTITATSGRSMKARFGGIKPEKLFVHLKARHRMIEDGELIGCPFQRQLRPPGNSEPPSADRANVYCNYLCHRRGSCPYLIRIKRAVDTPIVFLTHAHLKVQPLLDRLVPMHDILIIDEDAIFNTTELVELSQATIQEYLQFIRIITTHIKAPAVRASVTGVQSIGNTLLCISCREEAPTTLSAEVQKHNIRLPSSGELKVIQKLIHRHCRKEFNGGAVTDKMPPNLTYTFKRLLENAVPLWGHDNRCNYVDKIVLPKTRPVLILDAQANITTYRTILDTNMQHVKVSPIFKLRQTSKMFQFVDEPYRKTRFKIRKVKTGVNGETDVGEVPDDVFAFISTISLYHNHQRVGLITFKAIENVLSERIKKMSQRKRAQNRFPLKLYEDNNPPPPGTTSIIAIDHFGGVRGSNFFEEFDVLIVLGTQVPSGKTMQELYRTYCHDFGDMSKFREEKAWPVEHRESEFGLITFEYDDDCMNTVFESIVLRELYQCIGRIRPFRELPSDEPTRHPVVYILTNAKLRDDWYEIDGYLRRSNYIDVVQDRYGAYLKAKADKQDKMRELKVSVGRYPEPVFKFRDFFDTLQGDYSDNKERANAMDNMRKRYFTKQLLLYLGLKKATGGKKYIKVPQSAILNEISINNPGNTKD